MSTTTTPLPAGSVPRLTLPFLDTDPLTDVRLGLLLLPLWWALGIEQFIWPVIFGIAALKVVVLQRLHVRANRPVRWFALFIAAVLVSGLFVAEPVRWLTYARNFGAFAAGFLVLFVVTNRVASFRAVERLLSAALVMVLIASVVGLLAAVGLWRPSFQSLLGYLLPDAITATSYGQAIATRVVGLPGWFSGIGAYFRLSSFSLYGTHFASILAYITPFFVYRLTRERGWRKLLVGAAIPLLAINLIFTTGRVAMISLLAGAVYFAIFHSTRRGLWRLLAVGASSMALVLVLFSTTLNLATYSPETGVVGQVIETVETLVFARGEGSFASRFGVYEASLAGFAERPLFGWGTERDVEGLQLPAGSHSEYVAVLYRQGLFGVIAFAGLIWAVWRGARPPRGAAARQPEGTLLRFGRWFLVTALLNNLMADPAIDTTVYVLLWLLIALLLATADLLRKEADSAARAD